MKRSGIAGRQVALAFGVLAAGLTIAALSHPSAAHAVDSTYSVSGTVYGQPATGSPVGLGDTNVLLVKMDGQNVAAYMNDVSAASDGSWSISTDSHGRPLSAGTYTLWINDSIEGGPVDLGYVSEWLGHVQSAQSATTFTLGAGSSAATEDDTLAAASTVSGTVADASGTALAGAVVYASAPGDSAFAANAVTDSSGHYTLQQVGPQDTVISSNADLPTAGPHGLAQAYNTQWWDHASTAASATPVSLTPGANTPDIDFALTTAPTIVARVVDSSGDPISNIELQPWTWDAALGQYDAQRAGPYATDADGYVEYFGAEGGKYKVGFIDDLADDQNGGAPLTRTRYDSAWYDGKSSFSNADAVSLSGESTVADLGTITLAAHSGAPTFAGTPVIQSDPDISGSYLLAGIQQSPGTATVTVQWNRDGTPITGATQFGYTPSSDDTGHLLTATVTATLDGQTPATVTTAPVDLRQNFTEGAAPTISGDNAVGGTVSVTTGDWTPAYDSIAYQWYKTPDGGTPVAIDGQTQSSYSPVAADQGSTLSVSVTVSKSGYHNANTSVAEQTPVALGTLHDPTPTIDGVAKVGQQLTADPGDWGDAALSYQWFRTASGGSPVLITGANLQTYTATPDDYQDALTVTVTGTEPGFSSTQATSAPTDPVAAGDMTTGTPTVTGSTVYGSTLTVDGDVADWGPGTVALSYQWYRGSTVITGATQTTYVLQPADVGAMVHVTVTGTETGYQTTSTSTAGQLIHPASFTSTPTPTLSSQSSIRNTVTVRTGTWNPAPMAFSYQWQRNGVNFTNTGSDPTVYQLVPSDIGTTIDVIVTGSSPGYAPVAKTSNSQVITTFQAQFSTTGEPTTSNGSEVGDTLTSSISAVTYNPTPTTISYLWQRGTGDPNPPDGNSNYVTIPGATSSTYQIQPADLGYSITVRVTASKSGYKDDTLSADETDVVGPGDYTTTGIPTIAGSPAVGLTLTASPGTWAPAGATYTYYWCEAVCHVTDTGSNGIANPQVQSPLAVGPSYTVPASEQGRQLSVTAIASQTGYQLTNSSSALTGSVQLGAYTSTPVPTIQGQVGVNHALTAVVPAWTPAPSSFSYQWNLDGAPITGATSSQYTPLIGAVGHQITVTVVPTLSGYSRPSITSQPTAAVPPVTFASVSAPKITGTVAVGKTLTASIPTTSPSASSVGATFTYQWYASGSLIDGATASTYVPTPADYTAKHTLTVHATAHAPGYADKAGQSVKTVAVAAGTMTPHTETISDVTHPSGTHLAGDTFTVTSAAPWLPSNATFAYQWYRSGTAISGATAVTYVSTGSDYAKTLTVKVTGKATGYASKAVTSAATSKIGHGTIVTDTPTIAGTFALGQKLTAHAGDWGPLPVAFHWEWCYFKTSTTTTCTALKNGATSSYTITSTTLVGKQLEVLVYGTKTGYNTSATIPSAKTAAVSNGTITQGTVEVTGTLAVGSKLTAAVASWVPSTSNTYHYQWATTDGATTTPIAGATASTHTLTAADAGKQITVTAYATHTGYDTSDTATSAVTTKVYGSSAPTVTVSGTVARGKKLTAKVSNVGDYSVSYQWYVVSGSTATAISGATKSYHTVSTSTSYKGKSVRVVVTFTDATSQQDAYAPLVVSTTTKALA